MTATQAKDTRMPGSPIYELKVTLDEVEPPVWRTFHIPASASLFELHCVLQVVMGWTNSHLHEFVQGRKRYMSADPENNLVNLDSLTEKDITMPDFIHPQETKPDPSHRARSTRQGPPSTTQSN